MSDSFALSNGRPTPMGPVERYDTLADRAYEQLRHALMSGSFNPGQKLTIRKIAAVLNISATPARDAISRLVSERVLESGLNRTVSVPLLDAGKIREIYLMRTALEGLAAELGAANMSEQDISALERTQIALIAAMDRNDYKRVLEENETFHFSLYNASGAPMLVETIQQLWLKLGPSLNFLYPSYNHSRKGVSHHLSTIRALRARDPAQVRQAIESDLRDGAQELQGALDANLSAQVATPKKPRAART
ncbi:MAG: AtrA transcriptional regulator [Caulobacter sp.]|nr:AtrA transcriptional regulator [Caulobacter sp.]